MELDIRVAIYITILMIVLIALAWIGDVVKKNREANNPNPQTDPSGGPEIQEAQVTEVTEETTTEE